MRGWLLTIYLQDIGQQTAAARAYQLFKFLAAQTSPRQQRICDQLDSFQCASSLCCVRISSHLRKALVSGTLLQNRHASTVASSSSRLDCQLLTERGNAIF